MRPVRSLRFRLLAGAALWITLALGLAGAGFSALFNDHAAARFEAELSHHLDQLAARIESGADGRPLVAQGLSDPRFERPLSGLYWQVDGPAGALLRSRSLWDFALALPGDDDGRPHRHATEGPGGQHLLVLERHVWLADGGGRFGLAVAADQAELAAATRAFDRTLFLSLGVLAAALILAAVVQVQIGLRPLLALRRELAAVRAGRRRRLADTMPAEVMPLVDDLNALLTHAEEVVGRSRLEAGNMAHALKTNLAVLANEAASLAGPQARPMRQQITLMRGTIDRHLARARAAATRGVPGSTTPVDACVDGIVRTMAQIHRERGLVFDVAVAPGLVFAGDRQDLTEMIGNLVDNACKWARRRLRIGASPIPGGRLAVTVEDDGPGLPAGAPAAVPSPGLRLDESVPGSGLGLAMVQDYAQLYGGMLDLGPSPLGGLKAVVTLSAVA